MPGGTAGIAHGFLFTVLLPRRSCILTGQDDSHQQPQQQEQKAGQQEDTQPGEMAVWLQPSGTPT